MLTSIFWPEKIDLRCISRRTGGAFKYKNIVNMGSAPNPHPNPPTPIRTKDACGDWKEAYGSTKRLEGFCLTCLKT
jgi:hypothetical protein